MFDDKFRHWPTGEKTSRALTIPSFWCNDGLRELPSRHSGGGETEMAGTFQEWRQGAIEGVFLIAADRNHQQSQAQEMARRLADFIAGAKFTVHIAIYDFRLVSPTAAPVIDALKERDKAGVMVRIAYHHDRRTAQFTAAEFARIGGDPAPPG